MSDFLNPHIQRSAIRWTPGDVLPEVEQTGPAAPLLIDKDTGRLLVDLPAYSDPYTTNGLLHSIEADIVAIKDDTTKIPDLISGRVPVDVTFPATQHVSGTFWQTTQPVSLAPSTGSTLTTFTSTTSAQILAANSNRRGVVLSSPSTNTGICYVVIGTGTASATAFSFTVNPGDIINLAGINNALTGIWSAGSQTLYVTELS